MEKISVLMSIYYKENPEYLRESLQSLLNQTQIPDEILLIKDGPLTLALDNVIDEFKEAYPQIFTIKSLKENHGLAYALAYGVKEAKYEYIARMDSDDIAVPERLATQLIEMTKNYYDIYGGQIAEFEGTTENTIAKREVPTDLYHIKQFAHRRNPMNHVSIMYKKSVILNIGNYHSVNGFEDYDLWIRAIESGYKLGNSNDIFVYVRAGRDMLKRRAGLDYIKKNFNARRIFMKEKFYNFSDFFITTLGVTLTSLIPNKLRYLIYYKLLRK